MSTTVVETDRNLTLRTSVILQLSSVERCRWGMAGSVQDVPSRYEPIGADELWTTRLMPDPICMSPGSSGAGLLRTAGGQTTVLGVAALARMDVSGATTKNVFPKLTAARVAWIAARMSGGADGSLWQTRRPGRG